MKKEKFIVRKCVNRVIGQGSPMEHVTWDIMRKIPDGEEFVAEFSDCFRSLAVKSVKALNGRRK